MLDKKISIIIPVYGVEQYIRQCLESVINQTYKKLEIIVVNDGTKDNSMKIVEEYLDDKRIKIINKENGGLSSARNKGLKYVTGDYILFVDSDDWISEDLCEICMKNGDNEDIIAYNYIEYDEITKEIKKNIIQKDIIDNGNKNKKGYLLYESPYSPCTRLYKSSYLKKEGFKFLEIIYEDVFWGIEVLFLTDNIIYLDESLYYYRKHREGSITNTKKTNERIIREKKSYFEISKNINEFILKYYKNWEREKNFIAILEREYWTGLSDGKVNWNEINKDLKVFLESKIVCNTQKQLVIKKLNNIIKNKEIKKIEGLNLFSIYLWKMKIITWKAFRRRIIRK